MTQEKRSALHAKVADAPLALAGLVVGLLVTYFSSLTDNPGMAFAYRSSSFNGTVVFVILAAFFAHLGTHIKLSEIREGGLVMGGAILGGVIVPPLLIFIGLHVAGVGLAINQHLGLSLGGAATDVALSISAYRALIALSPRKEYLSKQLYLVATMLTLLAIGDDLLGVGILAILHAAHVEMMGLMSCLALAFTVIAVSSLPVLARLRTNIFAWIVLAFGGIAAMYAAGLHAEVGGCLVIIFAPEDVKHKLDSWIKGTVNVLLFYFGVQATLFSAEDISFGATFFVTMCGGFGGKVAGITGGFLVARTWMRRRGKVIDAKYENAAWRQPFLMAILAGVNATVALIFVEAANVKADIAAQATLGFLATLILVLLFSQIFRLTGQVAWQPYDESDNV